MGPVADGGLQLLRSPQADLSDSRLFYDGVRVLRRLLREASGRLAAVRMRDHGRAAKRRHREIGSQRDAQRRAAIYRRLLRPVARTIGYAEAALLEVECVTEPWVETWSAEARHYLELVQRVVQQTKRRVFDGETVPAGQKVVSLFEAHADIICKGGRQTHYGHKINLTTGRSALVVVEDGNPADSTRCLPMLQPACRPTGSRRSGRRSTADMRRVRIWRRRRSWAWSTWCSTRSVAWSRTK